MIELHYDNGIYTKSGPGNFCIDEPLACFSVYPDKHVDYVALCLDGEQLSMYLYEPSQLPKDNLREALEVLYKCEGLNMVVVNGRVYWEHSDVTVENPKSVK